MQAQVDQPIAEGRLTRECMIYRERQIHERPAGRRRFSRWPQWTRLACRSHERPKVLDRLIGDDRRGVVEDQRRPHRSGINHENASQKCQDASPHSHVPRLPRRLRKLAVGSRRGNGSLGTWATILTLGHRAMLLIAVCRALDCGQGCGEFVPCSASHADIWAVSSASPSACA